MEGLLDGFGWLADGDNWTGSTGVTARLVEHLWVSGASMLIALAVALPVGLWLGHLGRGGALAINVSNVGRAIPTFAVLSILTLTPLRLSSWSTII